MILTQFCSLLCCIATSNSKDNISNSNLIELSQKKLQEQEDELNQMLDELEEGIQLSQPFERAFCRQTNHQNREASQEIEDRTDEWQQTSSIQSDAQHLNGKTANFRDTDQQLKQLSHSQSRNETSVSIISQVRVDKNSISNNSNQIMSGIVYKQHINFFISFRSLIFERSTTSCRT